MTLLKMPRTRALTAATATTLAAVLVGACTSEAPEAQPTVEAEISEGADDPTTTSDTQGTTTADAGGDTVTARAEHSVERVEYQTQGDSDPEQNWGDLYLPAGEHAENSVPLVVLIHGGAWASQVGADAFDGLAEDLVERGKAVYNIEYRRVGTGGGWPTTFQDVADALDYIPELDRTYPELTTDDELVVGHSAGAQLAVWAGTREDLLEGEVGAHPVFTPTRVISLAGPLDMRYAATHGDDRIVAALEGTPDEVPDRYASVDPIQNINPGVPVIAVHGTNDTVVSPVNTENYVNALDAAGGAGEVIHAEGDDHVSLVSPDSAHYPMLLDLITSVSDKSIQDLVAEYGQ